MLPRPPAALTWLLLTWYRTQKPSVLGAASGAIAGLVAVTPAAGYVTVLASPRHRHRGLRSFLTSRPRAAINAMVDDALDVWAIHGMAGTWGGVALGLFASTTLAGGGLLSGNGDFFVSQIISHGRHLDLRLRGHLGHLSRHRDGAIGLRPTPEEEALGLDAAEHGETAYMFGT